MLMKEMKDKAFTFDSYAVMYFPQFLKSTKSLFNSFIKAVPRNSIPIIIQKLHLEGFNIDNTGTEILSDYHCFKVV